MHVVISLWLYQGREGRSSVGLPTQGAPSLLPLPAQSGHRVLHMLLAGILLFGGGYSYLVCVWDPPAA